MAKHTVFVSPADINTHTHTHAHTHIEVFFDWPMMNVMLLGCNTPSPSKGTRAANDQGDIPLN